jgi:methylenetetrahydrofolate reductase (NADPH)
MSSIKPLTLSFEFFPPKSFEGMEKLIETAQQFSRFLPDFFSVTFGAGGSTRQRTIETITKLQKITPISVAPHISCIGYDRNDLANLLEEYQKLGVKRIVVLRGDMPSGMISVGDFEFAHEFVKFIRVTTEDHFHIEVAAYPECHPLARDMEADIINLQKKFDAGANGAITQYFFNADGYFNLLDECARRQINMPIVPGIMPIVDFEKLMLFSKVCGAEIPRWLYKRLESYSGNQQAVREFGREMMIKMCEQLIHGGAPGLHFYTLNDVESTANILQGMSYRREHVLHDVY